MGASRVPRVFPWTVKSSRSNHVAEVVYNLVDVSRERVHGHVVGLCADCFRSSCTPTEEHPVVVRRDEDTAPHRTTLHLPVPQPHAFTHTYTHTQPEHPTRTVPEHTGPHQFTHCARCTPAHLTSAPRSHKAPHMQLSRHQRRAPHAPVKNKSAAAHLKMCGMLRFRRAT